MTGIRNSTIVVSLLSVLRGHAPWLIGRGAQRALQWCFAGVGAMAACGVAINTGFVLYRVATNRPLFANPNDDLVPDIFANALIAACCLATARDLRRGGIFGILSAFTVFLLMTIQATRFGPPGFGLIGLPFLLLTSLAALVWLAPRSDRMRD